MVHEAIALGPNDTGSCQARSRLQRGGETIRSMKFANLAVVEDVATRSGR